MRAISLSFHTCLLGSVYCDIWVHDVIIQSCWCLLKNNYFDDFKEGKEKEDDEKALNFPSSRLFSFLFRRINLHFHFVMIYYSAFFMRLCPPSWYAEQFSSEVKGKELSCFFDGMYVNLYRVERAIVSKGRRKTVERLFVKQKYNNMPQVSSIKIYISANNERASKRADFSGNKWFMNWRYKSSTNYD